MGSGKQKQYVGKSESEANLAEGWRKRRYKAHFISKLSDAAQEAAETQTWLEFALHCGYFSPEVFEQVDKNYEHIFAMLTAMERKADMFCNNRTMGARGKR